MHQEGSVTRGWLLVTAAGCRSEHYSSTCKVQFIVIHCSSGLHLRQPNCHINSPASSFGHIMRMDDNADAKRILLASPPADWRRQPGRPRITWLSTVQQDLKQHHLTLPEAADLAQKRPLWRMMSTYGATQS